MQLSVQLLEGGWDPETFPRSIHALISDVEGDDEVSCLYTNSSFHSCNCRQAAPVGDIAVLTNIWLGTTRLSRSLGKKGKNNSLEKGKDDVCFIGGSIIEA